jgi:predicted methyltransferase
MRYQARQVVVEAAAIYSALALQPQSRVADVGAGTGRYSLELARTLLTDGYVYATEIDLGKLANIRTAVADEGLQNVTALESRDSDTGLRPACCDGVFLRRVYHHLNDPASVASDLFAAVRPGGRLVIVDFEPGGWWSGLFPSGDLPASRRGHGVSPAVVVAELTAAGFVLGEQIDDWGAGNYGLIFSRHRLADEASQN